MSGLDPRSDEVYLRASEAADSFFKAFQDRPVRDWMLWHLVRPLFQLWYWLFLGEYTEGSE